jgi:Ser/Thr protein kinase RdoA (MazF antagonist)
MMLTAENLIYYLFERGLVTRESVLSGSVEISEIPRRNRNFKVTKGDRQGYFVKQVGRWEPDTLRTLQTEAQCYRLATEDHTFADLANLMPRYHSYDQRRAVLITELLGGAETITEQHFRNESFLVDIAEQLGRAFGSYHRIANENTLTTTNSIFPRSPAWALSLHDMLPHTVPDMSGGIYQMLSMVRQFPQFAMVLDKLRSEWRFDALIHGDIKWDNCVFWRDPNESICLKIIDWEMANWGDPCWDVASIFSAYLLFWVRSLPANSLVNPDLLVAQARFPIERMQPAIRSFWNTYTRCQGISGQTAQDLLRRSVLYASARSIQTAFELLQYSPQANSTTVLLLQLSMNVMMNPEDATSELLGIEG